MIEMIEIKQNSIFVKKNSLLQIKHKYVVYCLSIMEKSIYIYLNPIYQIHE